MEPPLLRPETRSCKQYALSSYFSASYHFKKNPNHIISLLLKILILWKRASLYFKQDTELHTPIKPSHLILA